MPTGGGRVIIQMARPTAFYSTTGGVGGIQAAVGRPFLSAPRAGAPQPTMTSAGNRLDRRCFGSARLDQLPPHRAGRAEVDLVTHLYRPDATEEGASCAQRLTLKGRPKPCRRAPQPTPARLAQRASDPMHRCGPEAPTTRRPRPQRAMRPPAKVGSSPAAIPEQVQVLKI